MLGIATRATLPKSSHENSGAFSSVLMALNLRKTTVTARMQLTPWQISVAHATPSTPILNPATNRMSAKIFDTDEQARKINGVLESPRAEKIPVAML